MDSKPRDVDAYINSFPSEVQAILRKLRRIIRDTAPEAEESIGYGMPAYKLNGPLVYFAAYPHHIGFYPTPSGIDEFKKDLSQYKGAKGSVQFPLDKPMPYDLITRIVQYRMKENLARKKSKSKQS